MGKGFLYQRSIEKGLVSVNGVKKDEEGKVVKPKDPRYKDIQVDLSTSLRHMLERCHDFKMEISRLQFVGLGLGVRVGMTPKAHPEIAGMGIEYTWGFGKFHFRRENDCVAINLLKNVNNALSKISIEKARRFSRKARDYKCVYNQQASGNVGNVEKIGFEMIEKMVKEVKTHRCSLDQDYSFITNS
jgi:hypothetical protein